MIPWAHPSPQPKRHLDRFSRFAHMTVECPYTLQWDAPAPKMPMGRSRPPSNTWFREPTRVFSPNGISIGSAVCAGLTSVTDRQTDRQTDRPSVHRTRSITIGRIYVSIRSTAMRPNNPDYVISLHFA